MRQGFAVRQRLESTVRIDPRLVLNSQVLQLAQAELEQAIEAEIAENPALERLQDDTEPLEHDQILASVAPCELSPHSDDYEFRRSVPGSYEEVDWLDLAADTASLQDHLVAQLHTMLPPEHFGLARYVVECLNERGYLQEGEEEIALATNSSLETVQLVVTALRSCEPGGIGARNLLDCLLLQLRMPQTLEQRLAKRILKCSMEDFIGRRTMRIARRFGVMPEVVEAAFAEIAELTPYPGEAFANASALRPTKAAVASPDVVLIRSDSGWSVEVRGADSDSLCVSRFYKSRFEEIQDRKEFRDEKRHVGHYVQRASDFIKCLEQRKKTLRAIGEYLLQKQAGFVNTANYEFLEPLTRTQLARDLGVHESTISRATADKFIQLPNGTVVPFDVFFKPALRVQKMIEEILNSENPDNPLSDDQIAELLARKGVSVARRTVNKYRDRTKLLSSRKRKSA